MPDLEETLIAWFSEVPCRREVKEAIGGMLVLCPLSPISRTALQIIIFLHLGFSVRFPLNKEFDA